MPDITYKGVGHTIEELCFGGVSGTDPHRTVTLVLSDHSSITGMWHLDRRNIEWVVDREQQVYVRIGTITRFRVNVTPA